jgi:phosphoribosylglycinamide formyltransferase-1
MEQKKIIKIAVFASHGGSDMQAIVDGCKSGEINGTVALVISNNSNSFALKRASNEGIDFYHLSSKTIPDENELNNKFMELLEKYEIDLIFLAGYMRKIGIPILRKYENRIFNIHPALLPRHGGKGMYGINVHQAVVDAGEQETGVTIHRVNEEYDQGDIVAQTTVPVMPGDTPELLADRVLEREHTFLVEVVKKIVGDLF